MFTSFAYTTMSHSYETNQNLRSQYINNDASRSKLSQYCSAYNGMSHSKLSQYCSAYNGMSHSKLSLYCSAKMKM